MTETTYYVKVKAPDGKSWWFLTSNGGMDRKRIHAAQLTADKAEKVVREIETENPGFSAKTVKIGAKR